MPEPDVTVYRPPQSGYLPKLRAAFAFVHGHGDSRYSDATLMRLVRAAEAAVDAADPDSLPLLVVGETPLTYDADTEVKHGGIVGMAICWNAEPSPVVLAVHRDRRREGVGSALLQHCLADVAAPVFWVGQSNRVAQQFLLAGGLMPTAINAGGALRYATVLHDEGCHR